MSNSKTIYTDHATGGTEDQYLVYVLYRDGDIPHYVGATIDSRRPYYKDHHARKDHNITSVEIVQECLSLEDASTLEDQLINQYGKTTDGGTLVNVQGGGHGLATEEQRAKISQSLKGRTLSDETKLKMSLAQRRRVLSEEAKLKMSLANKGRRLSDEHKAKIGQASKGRTHTDETKLKISQAKKGKPMSDEQKAKMSLVKKEYWANRKDTSYG